MKTLPVVTGKNTEVLRTVAEPVETVTPEIIALGETMKATMKKEKGIGIAAPQLGVSKRLIIATLAEAPTLLINPEIISFSAETCTEEEGCLSLPGEFGKVTRAKRVKVRYLDESGAFVERELLGLDARVVLHEIDHLNGVLFTDRLAQEQNIFTPAFGKAL